MSSIPNHGGCSLFKSNPILVVSPGRVVMLPKVQQRLFVCVVDLSCDAGVLASVCSFAMVPKRQRSW